MAVSPEVKNAYNQFPSVNFSLDEVHHQGKFASIYTTKSRFVVSQFVANGELECGVVVISNGVQGLNDYTLVSKPIAPPPASTKLLGVTNFNPTRVYVWDELLQCYKYRDRDVVAIATEGDIYMYTEVPCEVAQPGNVRLAVDAATGRTRIGAISPRTGEAGLLAVPQITFIERRTTPGLVAVKINFD